MGTAKIGRKIGNGTNPVDGGQSQILIGDALTVLSSIPDKSADMCITSPPYWGLRDYGVDGQLGLEITIDLYLQRMVHVFRQVKRVLKDDGTLWVNMGDTYLQQHGKGFNGNKRLPNRDRSIHARESLHGTDLLRPVKPKNLVGLPWRLAFALQEDGWILRSDIIWHKPNAIPESCKDRPTKSHEYLFLLAKNKRYYFDIDAWRLPHSDADSMKRSLRERTTHRQRDYPGKPQTLANKNFCHPKGKNRRTVWTIPTKGFAGAHFATFPTDLIEPCIRAGSRAKGVVLDPFLGSGTTGLVAEALNRRYIGIELNVEYAKMAKIRIARGGEVPVSKSEMKRLSVQLEMRI